MRILKIEADGLKLFRDKLEIDFTTLQRVRNDKNEMLYKISQKIYQNNAIAFVGINASGKTTTLKVISFVIQMLNNRPINIINKSGSYIENSNILNDLAASERVVFNVYFSTSPDSIYKLTTTIVKSKASDKDENQFIIDDEQLWEKSIKSIKTKKSIFDFSNLKPIQCREKDEEYLPDDVSIIISLNKKNNSKIIFRDSINWTNINLIRRFGKLPQELIVLLDPSIEYLNFNIDDNEKDIEIKLKFKNKEEILMNSLTDLNKYLSSGTIKGVNVFIDAILILKKGGYLIVDELENHFNKEIVASLIRLFMDRKVNKKGSVIIFSTHYPELLDEFERNDNIYITKNSNGISVENLSKVLKRTDIKKSEVYQSGYLEGTVPSYESFMKFKKALIQLMD
jgi:ABC-type multidrug transport system ATPase subunit